ncbi:hypothetical protein P6P90_02425 [Ectobacillus antri]|uniref:Uncharacterized protein n=1 Tax=Ectobacillus antri TaxID=2486280 RepID=A0ABT6H368_9BACI|nr:hypothetical protein [Ectobacillus antri]MDG4656181.1 hypothetical protein [Ectobacillus antri]MDG5752856.1 hypothetical protein [Ectobacillus antri]
MKIFSDVPISRPSSLTTGNVQNVTSPQIIKETVNMAFVETTGPPVVMIMSLSAGLAAVQEARLVYKNILQALQQHMKEAEIQGSIDEANLLLGQLIDHARVQNIPLLDEDGYKITMKILVNENEMMTVQIPTLSELSITGDKLVAPLMLQQLLETLQKHITELTELLKQMHNRIDIDTKEKNHFDFIGMRVAMESVMSMFVKEYTSKSVQSFMFVGGIIVIFFLIFIIYAFITK